MRPKKNIVIVKKQESDRVEDKDQIRRDIILQTEFWLGQGNEIKHIPAGKTGFSDLHPWTGDQSLPRKKTKGKKKSKRQSATDAFIEGYDE